MNEVTTFFSCVDNITERSSPPHCVKKWVDDRMGRSSPPCHIKNFNQQQNKEDTTTALCGWLKFRWRLVSGLGRGRVRNLVPDPTPVHNPYPSDSGRVSARVWVGSQGKNLIYSI